MTFGLNVCPMEISTRLFEIFLIDGEIKFIKVLLRMLELKKDEILKRDCTQLQKYILSEIIIECIKEFPIATLEQWNDANVGQSWNEYWLVIINRKLSII